MTESFLTEEAKKDIQDMLDINGGSGGGDDKTLWNAGEGDGSIVQSPTPAPDSTDYTLGSEASGYRAIAIGVGTTASGESSFSEGSYTIASGDHSHAEGDSTVASGANAHAEGSMTIASGLHSHAEWSQTEANGYCSHAEGEGAIAKHACQHVFGSFNNLDPKPIDPYATMSVGTYIEIVGNGNSSQARSNARTLDWSGNETLAGKLTVGVAPTNDMDVATKKYVDDNAGGGIQIIKIKYNEEDSSILEFVNPAEALQIIRAKSLFILELDIEKTFEDTVIFPCYSGIVTIAETGHMISFMANIQEQPAADITSTNVVWQYHCIIGSVNIESDEYNISDIPYKIKGDVDNN